MDIARSRLLTPSMRDQQLVDIMKSQGVQSRVIGGEVTTIEKLGGYLVALRYKQDFICGGTLIEARFVVSAAHCFLGRPNKSAWTVEGGISRLTDSGVLVKLKDYMVPAVFSDSDMHMDVAVILLETPLMGRNIDTVSLCSRSLTEGLHLTVSGWGLIDPKSTGPTQSIRTVTVPVVNMSQCRQTYKKAMTLSNSMFCAGVLGTKDACTFDSGGPLIYDDINTGHKELCGIVSFGIGCASPKYAGVYTNVNYVKPFIQMSIDVFRKSLM
ncbi:seminase [Drosophila innubila]|uniref:seminase n=1 Tax=Drosophila innubila TaxID=198719 RepID=UPI00148DC3DA|nr:seminase [Drosophila innubila]